MSKIDQDVFYRSVSNEIEIFEHTYKNRLPLILKGPTGCGKSRFVEFSAKKLGIDLITVSCNEDTSASDLIGRYIYKNESVEWIDGPVTRAVRNGMILYLDEITEAREDVTVLIHSLTDHRRELFIDKTNEKLKATENFYLIASYNPSYQRGLKKMKPSTLQRFVSLEFNYPPTDIEVEIVSNESHLEEKKVKKLIAFSKHVRTLGELNLAETISTRLIINSAKLIKSGVDERSAVITGMTNPLSDDSDISKSLQDLVMLSF
ncbi:MAG: CbbQ/NirQ/NorQ/GpvN family protein [Halobacteriovoraceae bacterium]|nr:CbbQ/NirQ/NorQ/GpvN family protein [Halobacteriovoraceae bacterium]MCB9095822.1 CbbQ/NirQ/NorQ/GpvN family protein [Halobacteriovoraceae bacterium]